MGLVKGHVFVLALLVGAGCIAHYEEPAEHAREPIGDPGTAIRANDPRGVWMAVQPTQCSPDDAWRRDWVDSNGGAEYPRDEDESILIAYCSKRGVWVLDSIRKEDPQVACAACTCPAHYIVFLLVREADATIVAEFGGRPMRPEDF